MNLRRMFVIVIVVLLFELGMCGDVWWMMMMYSVIARFDDERRRRRGAELYDFGVE